MQSKIFVFLSAILGVGCTLAISCSSAPVTRNVAAGRTAPANSGDPSISAKINGVPTESILCQQAPKLVADANRADFSGIFNFICQNGNTTQAFRNAIATAYDGSGQPNVTMLSSTSDEMYTTDLVLIHAIKTPLENPSVFGDLRPHDAFASGIREGKSEMAITVASRQAFPGKRAVERIVLDYNLKNSEGAAILDKRRTEFNSYLIVENNRDLVVSTEHLLDEATNINYHKASGMTIGIKDSSGSTYVLFITELVVKNRIDPERMKTTMTNINIGVDKILINLVKEK